MSNNKKLGQYGENIVLTYYKNKGYKKIAQNFYTRYGELDLVLEKNKKILVIEVKTRSNNSFGWGEETVNRKKIRNIKKAYNIIKTKKKLPEFYVIEICVLEIGPKITLRRFMLD